jgi:hypothetical protein
MTPAINSALRNPILLDLRNDIAMEIGVRQSTPVAGRLLDILTVVVARSYTMICRGDSRYPILGREVDRLWRVIEKISCEEAQRAAKAMTQSALSQETKTAAGIELAGFLTETLKISPGRIPPSIRDTSDPVELARIDQYDYFIGATQELLSGRWNRPTIISPHRYLRHALLIEAHRYYMTNLAKQRVEDFPHLGVRPALRPNEIVVPVDLHHGLAVLRAAGLPQDLAMLIAERYLRHQGPGDIGIDAEIAEDLGWSPGHLERVQTALRRGWGARMRQWFFNGCYRPRKKLKNRVGGEGENLPL